MSSMLSALYGLAEQVRARLRSDTGLEAIEYALLAALVAVVVIAAVTLLNPSMGNAFNTIGQRVNDAANAITLPN